MELAQEGLTDKNVKLKLKSDEKFRARYLALYDMVNILVNISQAKFSVLATTARKTPFVNSSSYRSYCIPSTLCSLFQANGRRRSGRG